MSASVYYNENEPYAAAWLKNLMGAGHIPAGDIDTRSIEDVRPSDLRGYTQCHFFAGIGGWAFALALAGWPSDRPVWTGSCPCQPFSVAGKGAGFADQRHLWPSWQHLIAQRSPPVIFGEQVASATEWLGLVFGDLEAMGYAVAGEPIEAASAGADHYRDRYWIVADNDQQCAGTKRQQRSRELRRPSCHPEDHARTMAHGHGHGQGLAIRSGERGDAYQECAPIERSGGRTVVDLARIGWGEGWTESEFRSRGFTAAVASIDGRQYVECPDGKWRALPPPGVRWLGNGIPARVAKLRAFGNAIDPRPAAEFISAYIEAKGLSFAGQAVAA
jgi:DNA (cytosine-5)-methyltransferase 1